MFSLKGEHILDGHVQSHKILIMTVDTITIVNLIKFMSFPLQIMIIMNHIKCCSLYLLMGQTMIIHYATGSMQISL